MVIHASKPPNLNFFSKKQEKNISLSKSILKIKMRRDEKQKFYQKF